MPVLRLLSSTLRRMSLAYADEAIHLREVAALSDRDIARATGSGVSTVSAWLRRERAPRGRRAGRPGPDGRWQRGEQLAGLYLAADPDTVWAEWYRALAELGEPPDTWLPRELWRFSLNLQRVADLSRPAALRALGLPSLKPD